MRQGKLQSRTINKKLTQCAREGSNAVGDTLNGVQDVIGTFGHQLASDGLSNGTGKDRSGHAEDSESGDEELGEEHG